MAVPQTDRDPGTLLIQSLESLTLPRRELHCVAFQVPWSTWGRGERIYHVGALLSALARSGRVILDTTELFGARKGFPVAEFSMALHQVPEKDRANVKGLVCPSAAIEHLRRGGLLGPDFHVALAGMRLKVFEDLRTVAEEFGGRESKSAKASFLVRFIHLLKGSGIRCSQLLLRAEKQDSSYVLQFSPRHVNTPEKVEQLLAEMDYFSARHESSILVDLGGECLDGRSELIGGLLGLEAACRKNGKKLALCNCGGTMDLGIDPPLETRLFVVKKDRSEGLGYLAPERQ